MEGVAAREGSLELRAELVAEPGAAAASGARVDIVVGSGKWPDDVQRLCTRRRQKQASRSKITGGRDVVK